MEPDDLLCSRNARSRTPLVGRAQWEINQPPSLKRKQASLEGLLYGGRPMRAVKDGLPTPYGESKKSDRPRSTRALEDQSGPIPEEITS
jgi:hypothetical protein